MKGAVIDICIKGYDNVEGINNLPKEVGQRL